VSAGVHLGLLNDIGAVLHLHASARTLAFIDRMAGAQATQAGSVSGLPLAAVPDER